MSLRAYKDVLVCVDIGVKQLSLKVHLMLQVTGLLLGFIEASLFPTFVWVEICIDGCGQFAFRGLSVHKCDREQ